MMTTGSPNTACIRKKIRAVRKRMEKPIAAVRRRIKIHTRNSGDPQDSAGDRREPAPSGLPPPSGLLFLEPEVAEAWDEVRDPPPVLNFPAHHGELGSVVQEHVRHVVGDH